MLVSLRPAAGRKLIGGTTDEFSFVDGSKALKATKGSS
jgi:hypothetical protein